MKRISATVILTFGLLFGAVAGSANLAGAQSIHASSADCYPGCTGSGGGDGLTGTSPTPSSSSSGSGATSSSTTLAFTGADVAGTVGAGVVLIGGGVVLVGATRRRRQIV